MAPTKLKVGAVCALIVVAASIPLSCHPRQQPGLRDPLPKDAARPPGDDSGAKAMTESRQVSLYMVFTVTNDSQIHVASKIIEAPPGLILTKEDCSTDNNLKTKGALLMTRPQVVVASGQAASIFVGSQQPASRIPREGVALEILPVLVGGNIHYTGSVAVFRPPRKGEGKSTRLSGAARPQVRTNAFAGDCKVGEAVLHTATSDGRN